MEQTICFAGLSDAEHRQTKIMNEFKFNCSHCEQHLKCDAQFVGREIQCPNCNHLIRIPAPPGQTANFQPEVGQTWATHVAAGVLPSGNLSIKPRDNQNAQFKNDAC
jgi:hypothetical protein